MEVIFSHGGQGLECVYQGLDGDGFLGKAAWNQAYLLAQAPRHDVHPLLPKISLLYTQQVLPP